MCQIGFLINGLPSVLNVKVSVKVCATVCSNVCIKHFVCKSVCVIVCKMKTLVVGEVNDHLLSCSP